jgi:hypothetical protein
MLAYDLQPHLRARSRRHTQPFAPGRSHSILEPVPLSGDLGSPLIPE